MQSSVAEGGIPQKAVDGSTSTFFDLSTCSLTEVEKSPWWYVNLLEPYMVQLVRIDFGQSCCGKYPHKSVCEIIHQFRSWLGQFLPSFPWKMYISCPDPDLIADFIRKFICQMVRYCQLGCWRAAGRPRHVLPPHFPQLHRTPD